MHHFIYPTQDAYVSNKSAEINKNFGLDEMLVAGVSQSYARVINYTKTYSYSNNYVAGMQVDSFTGRFTGSAFLYSSTSTGSIVGGYNNFSSRYFSGSLTGSVSGYETGSSFTSFNFSGSLRGFSGSITANAINGLVSGSLSTTCFSLFTGTLINATGSLTGYLTGDDVREEQNTSIINRRFIKRSLLKFDLSFISQSIVSGDITNPKFYLKMYVTEARELPIEYSIFVFPTSQSWVQGDGYWSDGGSNEGVSWNWRNKYSGSNWFTPQLSDIITSSIDYLGNYGYVSESFKRGGGTWYNIPCSQSFSYESSDLNVDVTSIVNSWLNRSIVNNGFIVMCSEETNPSGSNAHLFFFSRETNTIYSPHLDIAWDDNVWITGSIGTGSVTTYPQTGSLNNVFTSGFLSNPNISSTISCSMISNYPQSVTSQLSGSLTGSINFIISSTGSYYATGSNGNTYTGSISGSVSLGNLYGIVILGDLSGSFITGSSSGNQFSGSYGGTFVTYNISDFSGSFSGSGINGNLISKYVYGNISGTIVSGSLSGSISTGNLSGSLITGSSDGTYFVGGLYDSEYFLSSSLITGGISSSVLSNAFITSSLYSGYVSGYINGQVVSGIFTTGDLSGNSFVGTVVGSYSTSSYNVVTVITESVFNPINSDKPFVLTIQNLKKEYNFGDNPRINIFSREKIPLKTFEKASQQSSYVKTKLLPSSSFYAIKDNETEEFIVNFDNYTKISCDLSGHYFDLNTSALEKERYYKIIIKVECLDGNVYTFDDNAIFQIRR